MCGIVGFVGRHGAADVLLNGLRRLEYRGYDSAGIAVIGDEGLAVAKCPGKVARLSERVSSDWSDRLRDAPIGIAHTRWATHGAPTEANAHPHADNDGRLVLVHNGVIENYVSLRQRLLARGHTFHSETDTEVLAHLIGEFHKGDLFSAVAEALRHATGAYGIAVMAADEPDRLIVARKGSPLVIGLGPDSTFVASDVSALVSYTRQVLYLDDGDIAIVTATGADIRTLDNARVDRSVTTVDWDDDAVEKGGHPHFMLKEIFEQPEALHNAMRGRVDVDGGTAKLSGLRLGPREQAAVRRVVVVGCGTSLHAGMVGKYAFEELADIPLETEQAAEFRYRNPIIGPDTLVIAISQSGETADTLAAVREAERKGAHVVGICNVVGSTIAREVGRGVYLHVGPEIGVASTKAFTAQVLVLSLMAVCFGRGRRLSHEEGTRFCRELQNVPELVRRVLARNDEIAEVAERLASSRDAFFIGRGCMHPVAMEGALKLKEISYVHAEGYHAAELKHGPIALLDEQVPVVAMLNDIPGKDKVISNVEECRARHAPVIGVVTEGDQDVLRHADAFIRVPAASPVIATIPTTVALQLLSYHVARLRGCPIDQPRNLAKSVTVE